MFEQGEYIVYGSTGVCKVEKVTTMDMDGVPGDKLYYILRPYHKEDREIFTPVDNKKTKMRKLLSSNEIKYYLNEFNELEDFEITKEKFREDNYKQCVRGCDFREILRLVKSLLKRKRSRLLSGKNFPSTDERYLKIAENILFSEISYVLKLSKNEVEDLFRTNMKEMATT